MTFIVSTGYRATQRITDYIAYIRFSCCKEEQVVKLIWHKATSPPHTDGSVVFATLRQCAPHLLHPNRHPHRTGSAPCWVALSISNAGHVRGCPEPAHFRPQNYPFTCGDLDSHSNTRFLGPFWPTQVHIANGISIGSAVFAGLMVVIDRSTDRKKNKPRYFDCNSRPHLAVTTAIRRKKTSWQNSFAHNVWPSHEGTLAQPGEYDWTCASTSFGQPESTTQTANRSVQPFLHSSQPSVVGHAQACSFP